VAPEEVEISKKRKRPSLGSYFIAATAAQPGDVRASLWNDGYAVAPADAPAQGRSFDAALLDQYKLYVEMADRVSSRRGLANTFFLTLNTAVFTAIGVLWKDKPSTPGWWLVFPLAVLLTECMLWFWTIRSYRQLNSGKFAVIGAIEERLPAQIYWKAEWVALGEGRDPARYWPVTHIEQWVPLVFAAIYTAGFVTLLLA
jgi:hypothetical protein